MPAIYSPSLSTPNPPSRDGATLTYAAAMILNLNSQAIQEVTLAGNVSFTGSGYSAGRKIDVIVRADGSTRNVAFDSAWVFVGTKPTTIASGKVGRLTLLTNGDAAANVVAQWAVQT